MVPFSFIQEDDFVFKEFEVLGENEKKTFWQKFSSDEKFDLHKRIKSHYIQQQGYKCAYCKNEILTNHGMVWDIEHIVSRDECPNFTYESLNLCVCCKDCNINKSKKRVLKNHARKKYPNSQSYFKIPHPHFSRYEDHILKKDFLYLPLTEEGTELISFCKLTRFVKMKVNGGFINSESNDELLNVAKDCMEGYVDTNDPLKLVFLKGVISTILENKKLI